MNLFPFLFVTWGIVARCQSRMRVVFTWPSLSYFQRTLWKILPTPVLWTIISLASWHSNPWRSNSGLGPDWRSCWQQLWKRNDLCFGTTSWRNQLHPPGYIDLFRSFTEQPSKGIKDGCLQRKIKAIYQYFMKMLPLWDKCSQEQNYFQRHFKNSVFSETL